MSSVKPKWFVASVRIFYGKQGHTHLSTFVQTRWEQQHLTFPILLILPFSSTQAVVHPWRASQAAWRRPWIQETWSRTPSITSLQPISSTLSSPHWSEAGDRPCPEATATSAPEGTMKRPCCSVLMTSSDDPVSTLVAWKISSLSWFPFLFFLHLDISKRCNSGHSCIWCYMDVWCNDVVL